MSLVVVYLASPRAAAWMKWTRVDCLCASLTLLRKFAPPLPVVVFHEDYIEEDIQRLRAIVPDIRLEQVDFSTHKEHFVSHRPTERVGSYGYNMMCRFFSGIVQAHPALAEYTHYLRLDDDSYIVSPVSAGAMDRMQNSDYSYNSLFYDPQPSLWAFTHQFTVEHGLSARVQYTDQAPYTNYHAASLALWRHPVVNTFIQTVDRHHGCLKHGWTDSSIQMVLLSVFCPLLGLRVNLESEFPYRHNIQCVHQGAHTRYCHDGLGQSHSWGPPVLD